MGLTADAVALEVIAEVEVLDEAQSFSVFSQVLILKSVDKLIDAVQPLMILVSLVKLLAEVRGEVKRQTVVFDIDPQFAALNKKTYAKIDLKGLFKCMFYDIVQQDLQSFFDRLQIGLKETCAQLIKGR
jgi:ATP-dependent phosphoenolpyruvate carboxykinase